MGSFAEAPAPAGARALALALVLALAPAGAAAQAGRVVPADAGTAPAAARMSAADARTWVPPASLASRIAQDIAVRWSVDPARMVLDWGRIPPPAGARLGAARLAGVSADGLVLLDVPVAAPAERVRLALRAGVRSARPVAARALARGDVLRAGDVTEDTMPAWGAPARAGEQPAAVPAPGWRVNRYVAAGEPLAPPTVLPPAAVRAGERVQAVYVAGSLQLTFAATAVTDAATGQPVPLRTDDGRRLVGVAEENGTVRLTASPRMP